MDELFSVAKVWTEMGSYQASIGIYDQIIADYPHSYYIYRAYNNKGCCYSMLERYNEAIECYDASLSQQYNTGTMLNKACALYNLEHYGYTLNVLEYAMCRTPVTDTYLDRLHALYDKVKRVNTESQPLQFSQNEYAGVENTEGLILSDDFIPDNQNQALLGGTIDISLNIIENN